MTDISNRGTTRAPGQEAAESDITVEHRPARAERSGWMTFAGVVLIIAGVSRVFDSVWAFQYHRAIPENLQGAVFGTSLNVYAWLWLFVGAALILVGLGLMSIGWLADSAVARWAAVAVAGIGAITAMSWMAFYPVWTIMYVAVAVLVIYAVIVHPTRAARN